ncbi:MAG: nucleotidyl transferase AbiEii/AbiGii toxin family protein [Candidatus Melainabacteria bacterium]|nr:nucleotidyl transferase AbiEii/AbiGii toxin family protein [Candidatus Melainabacteria bacterium]
MIPRAVLTFWREHHAPWPGDDQVEQDLVLSKVLIELFSDELIGSSLAFRGGTALNKLFLPSMSRYSDDIDLVKTRGEPIGPVMGRIKDILRPWLGKPKYKQTEAMVTFYFSYMAEPPMEKPMRLKLEINTRENFAVYGYETRLLEIKSDWFTGKAEINTFTLDELLGTKLRALYQRKKGRDLFDPWLCQSTLSVNPERVVHSFLQYMSASGIKISRAEFEENLLMKLEDVAFRGDIAPLLRPGVRYDFDAAAKYMMEEIVSRLPGKPWKRPE